MEKLEIQHIMDEVKVLKDLGKELMAVEGLNRIQAAQTGNKIHRVAERLQQMAN